MRNSPVLLLREVHQIGELHKTHLRLDHPKLAQMARCVGVLGAERRGERVHARHRVGHHFSLQLSRHGEKRARIEERVQIDLIG